MFVLVYIFQIKISVGIQLKSKSPNLPKVTFQWKLELIHEICISVELEAMEEHLKALEGVVARLETLSGAKLEVSPT